MSQKSLTQRILFIILISSILLAACAPATPTILSGNPGTHLQPTPVPLPIIAVADVETIVSAYCGGQVRIVSVDYESKNGKASVTYGCSKATDHQFLSSISPFVKAYCGETNNEITVAIKAGDSNSVTSYKVDCKITATKDEYGKLIARLDQTEKDLKATNEELTKLKTRADEVEKQLAALKAAQTITSTVPITSTSTITTTAPITSTIPVTTTTKIVVGSYVIVTVKDGASYLTRAVPAGSDWNQFKTGKGAPMNETGYVLEIDPSGKFANFVSSMTAKTGGWVDIMYLSPLVEVQTNGSEKLIQTYTSPAGTSPLQFEKLVVFAGEVYQLQISNTSGDFMRLWVDDQTMYYGKPKAAISFPFNFKCVSPTDQHFATVESYQNGGILYSTARYILPCGTPISTP